MPDTLREKIAEMLYGELSDGPEGEVHPYDERWYNAADRILAIPELQEALELKALVDGQQGKSVTDAVLETQRSKLGHSISTNTKER